jgi:hypothetical protein
MNTTRHGKIARLPKAVRAELNRRIENGEPGKQLVVWLNALPEVQAVVAAEFGGKPVREQNLSEWKQGGYRDWVAQQEALELAERLGEDAAELGAADRPPLTDTLALWLAARYAVATRQVSAAEGAEGWRRLREFCADIVELRRGDHSGARLKLERERLEREREKTEEEVVAQFERWAENPEVRDWICQAWINPEEQKRRLRAIFGIVPGETPPSTQDATPESHPIKPDQTESNQNQTG